MLGHFDGQDVYFVHSQVFSCEKKYIVSETFYHKNFPSAIRHKHILGVQFHPEKSLKLGQELLIVYWGYMQTAINSGIVSKRWVDGSK